MICGGSKVLFQTVKHVVIYAKSVFSKHPKYKALRAAV